MRRADVRLHLRLAEARLSRPSFAASSALPSPAAITADSSSLAPSALPADRRAMPMPTCASCRLGVDRQRRAELLLGGARAALLEQPPAVRQQLLRVGRRGRRGGRLLVGEQVALLVFFPRAARAGDRCGPPRRAVRAPLPRRRRSWPPAAPPWRVMRARARGRDRARGPDRARLLARLGVSAGLPWDSSLLGTGPYRKKAVAIMAALKLSGRTSRFPRRASSTGWPSC